MYEQVERSWVALVDSQRFRRITGKGVGAAILRSEAYQKVNIARRYATSLYQTYRDPALFHDVTTYCLFIGHNKSGTSMIGALLDAHPDVILADEADALQYMRKGFRRDQIFHILLKGSRREAMKGRVTARRVGAYSFLVPNQWQGRYRTLRVIGDSTSGSSTRRFARDPGLLEHVQSVMSDVNVRLIQVIRNPYDSISYMMIRGKRTFDNAIAHYFEHCETLIDLRQRLDSSQLFAMKYEDFIYQPKRSLSNICRFLGIGADDTYLDACTAILRSTPDRHRQMVAWDTPWIALVQAKIDRYEFLHGYSFEA